MNFHKCALGHDKGQGHIIKRIMIKLRFFPCFTFTSSTYPFVRFARDFAKKEAPRPDFATISRSVAKAKKLKTSSAAYKYQLERLLSLSNSPQPTVEDEVEEGVLLVKKKRAGPARVPTSAPSKEVPPPTQPGVIVATLSTIPQAIVPITTYFAEGPTRKRQKRPAKAPAKGKVMDFLGSKDDDLSEAVQKCSH
ncbi:unnamed protein product [Fraxinus pennsylvanica]|uniref:Uncharacterized protein n=1 Tax=Fraxinus pennsylvanica TaxID=56036 RepID=A0AAD1YYA2_9LAMI|nr:unnamed protein product [Fraxinus pennsylvanica]